MPTSDPHLELVEVPMGCGDPVSLGHRYLDWPVANPATAPVEVARVIRDEIAGRVTGLLAELQPAT
ncbi:hypothetical protein DN069_03530 [Streptacidiphilus pinicola]|uniref:Phosphotyrosine protein phosphatase I domain-containing protein n=1 Tax=Streptacidiphilus pinicola TaxID=2219663 RepID=A0A2X0IQY7_9ACTN|nr:hypothetical protein [Streptacidiphilus pinicola]RAG87037.1 hypothetical protein DN069_03530 [Streptacidiphilus pinicola]